MARTLSAGAELKLDRKLTAEKNGYRYSLERVGSVVWYEVANGPATVRVPVFWVFGTGRTGQTFVFSREGKLYESRVSYYPAIGGLDLTMGAANSAPRDLEEAAGRLMSKADVSDCFGCHSTSRHMAKIVPGVQCELCHGETSSHPAKQPMKSLKKATTDEITELCGACHRTWEQVKLLNLRGVAAVRFQPYRLSQSKCYDLTDRRISCTACHDPHQPQIMSEARVDRACQSCHAAAEAKHCPKAKQDCATCHMPKYDLPGAHAKFSDHRIRVAHAGEAFLD